MKSKTVDNLMMAIGFAIGMVGLLAAIGVVSAFAFAIGMVGLLAAIGVVSAFAFAIGMVAGIIMMKR